MTIAGGVSSTGYTASTENNPQLVQLRLQRMSMDAQTSSVQDLLQSLPSLEPGKGQHIDVRV